MSTKPKPEDQAFRDHVAVQVACICVTDLSRQLSGGMMPIDQAPQAVDFIARFSYSVADSMLAARNRKEPRK